jgi:hypothetical protein
MVHRQIQNHLKAVPSRPLHQQDQLVTFLVSHFNCFCLLLYNSQH